MEEVKMFPGTLLFVYLLSVSVSLALETDSTAPTEWLAPDETIEFTSKPVPHFGLLNRLYWYEKNERSTSKNYTLWKDADVHLLEWPGNITVLKYDQPLVKWGRQRAKYIEDPCGRDVIGIEMRAYAYKYVYLTWGPNRLSRTVTEPLSVPRSLLPPVTLGKLSRKHSYDANKLNTVLVYDIAFAFDTLLLAFTDGVIRVSGLELAYAEMSEVPRRKLKYSLARGIKGPVDQLIVQSCCLKTDFCPFGNVVVAYQVRSFGNRLFTSYSSGENFRELKLGLPQPGALRVAIPFPESNRLLIFHGNDSMISGKIVYLSDIGVRNGERDSSLSLDVVGNLRGGRLGLESSYVIWDNCSVWYSSDSGFNLTKSVFYVHKKLRENQPENILTSKYCTFGSNSALAVGRGGKFAIMDGQNFLFLGIDGKSNLSQLIATRYDMTALLPGTELSVAPTYEYESDQPKLMYPPRFLRLPKEFKLGKSYTRRLAMRILPKNVYPSDFIQSFYEENIYSNETSAKFGLKICQTSSLKVNYSITQKTKLYHISGSSLLNFTVEFTSRLSKVRQLFFEPATAKNYLSFKISPRSIDEIYPEDPRYIMNYRVVIRPAVLPRKNKVIRINLFTKQDHRCNYLPRVTIFIKVETGLTAVPNRILSDEDMSRSRYLKSVAGDVTQYFDTGLDAKPNMDANTCSKQ